MEINSLIAYATAFARTRLSQRNEDGMETIQVVIIAAVMAALAIAVGVIITNKVTSAANGIKMH